MAALPASEALQHFLALCEHPEAVQRDVLLDILQRSAATEIGRRHRFDRIDSVRAFQDEVPLSDWGDYEEASERMQHGVEDVLFEGRPVHFVMTSGTSAKPKLLPESAAGAQAKAVTSRFRTTVVARLAPAIADGRLLPLANAGRLDTTPCGIPVGMASGLTLAGLDDRMRAQIAYPLDLLQIDDANALDYCLMRFALCEDVREVAGNNAGRLGSLLEMADRSRDTLLSDIERGALSVDTTPVDLSGHLRPDAARADALRAFVAGRGRLDPRDYWPDLEIASFWLGGSVGRYVDTIRPWLGERVRLMDCGYGASEGKFNIPMHYDSPAGTLALHGAFYEFIPLDGGAPRLAHELDAGASYRIVVTTCSGLYRYDLHDIVRVAGRTAATPEIEFTSKAGEVANICGEKTALPSILLAMDSALRHLSMDVRHFCLVADGIQRRYDLCVEGDASADLLNAFFARLEEACVGYLYFRKQGLLAAPRLVRMRDGWQGALYADRLRAGVSTNQIKLPVVYDDIPHPEFISEIMSTVPRPPGA